jgi:chromate transporter
VAAQASALSVFWAFLRLGFSSFGGPVAHMGYFRNDFVERRKWLDESSFADLVPLCQFLPGPASSKLGICIGIGRAGLMGGLAAWVGFTLPSAVAMTLFAYGVTEVGDVANMGWLHGLKVMAVAVIAQAVWGMARTLCPDRSRATLALVACVLVLAWPGAVGQLSAIAVGALVGRLMFVNASPAGETPFHFPVARWLGILSWCLFFVLLAGLPLLAWSTGNTLVAVIDGFFRVGALVFGGGHVLLPLLQVQVVPPGWISNDAFLAGYGAAQAVPGPLITFACYLGSVMKAGPGGWLGGLLCLSAVYVPVFLMVIGTLPFWNALRARADVRSALTGINAAVVGLLLAALFNPVWTGTVHSPRDFILVLAVFGALVLWKLPPWLVAILSALLGAGVAMV